MKNMEKMSKLEKYKNLLELQLKFKTGIVKDEDLTYEQKILLNRLYDMQMQKLEAENEKNFNRIKKYRKKAKIQS